MPSSTQLTFDRPKIDIHCQKSDMALRGITELLKRMVFHWGNSAPWTIQRKLFSLNLESRRTNYCTLLARDRCDESHAKKIGTKLQFRRGPVTRGIYLPMIFIRVLRDKISRKTNGNESFRLKLRECKRSCSAFIIVFKFKRPRKSTTGVSKIPCARVHENAFYVLKS